MVAVPLNYISIDERGVAYISGTRMKVRHIAIDWIAGGMAEDEIQQAHPHLSLAQIHAALAYYYSHKAEIDTEIAQADREAERILAEVGTPVDAEALKRRLHGPETDNARTLSSPVADRSQERSHTMRLRKTVFCSLLVCASCALLGTGAAAQTNHNTAKDKAIRRLLELTGAVKVAQQSMDQMMASMKQAMPNVPAEFWTEFRKKIKTNELIDKIVPVYDKYYTREDINGLIAFYESPLGRKVTATLPQIAKETMMIGQEWGREKAEEVMRELQKRRNSPKEQTGRKGTPKPQARVQATKSAALAAVRLFGSWPLLGG